MTIYAVLRYRDPDAALTWLQKAFDCTEHSVSRTEDGSFQHGELRLGESLFMISAARDEQAWLGSDHPMDPLASPISLYASVEDPRAHYERAKAEGATIVAEVTEMPYGSTEYSARDPEGNLWSFGTYAPS